MEHLREYELRREGVESWLGKKDKKGLFKKVINIVKKESQAERRKNEQKKKKNRNKPKGMGAKRMGMVFFWTLFLFMFLVTVVNLTSSPTESKEGPTVEERNKLFNNEGLEFSRSFIHNYFNWEIDKHGEDRWLQNVENYFTDDVSSLNKIAYDKEWASSVDKRDIVFKNVERISDSKARYVFSIQMTMKSPTDKKDDKFEFDKMNFDEVVEVENKVRVIKGYEVKTVQKYISVPVYYDKETDRMAVFDLPSFTYVNEGSEQLVSPENRLNELRILSDGYVENNIISFLNTFFETYSSDSRDKISYILEDETHQYGLRGTMKFSKIDNLRVYRLDENHNRFIADAEVVLEEPTTKTEFLNKYLLVIKRKDQRYIIESLNNEKYIDELITDHIIEDDEDIEDLFDQEVDDVPSYEYEETEDVEINDLEE